MSCKVIEIIAANGKPSLLYAALEKKYGQEVALKAYLKSEIETLEVTDRDINGEPTIASLEEKDIISKYYSTDEEPAAKKSRKELADEKELIGKVHYFKNKLKAINKNLLSVTRESDPDKFEALIEEKSYLEGKIYDADSTLNRNTIYDLGLRELNEIEYRLENDKDNIDAEMLVSFTKTLEEFKSFSGLMDKAFELDKKLWDFKVEFVTEQANKYTNRPEKITEDDILGRGNDIGRYGRFVGALADVGDVLGQTAASMIKAAQNRISKRNTEAFNKIKPMVDKFIEYQKSKGIPDSKIYDILLQEKGNTLVLTQPYTTEYYEGEKRAWQLYNSDDPNAVEDGKRWLRTNKPRVGDSFTPLAKYNNPVYAEIQRTPELREFYNFYKEMIETHGSDLPVVIDSSFIPNSKKGILDRLIESKDKGAMAAAKEIISNFGRDKELDENGLPTLGNSTLFTDEIQVQYHKAMSANVKSKDLGNLLIKFVSFTNTYSEMDDVLPKVRMVQSVMAEKEYIDSHQHKIISGDKSNIFALLEDYIKMQVKGEMKRKELRVFKYNSKDIEGNDIQKEVFASDIVDFGLRYNSLLRIGLNPFNMINNAIFGKVSNLLEAFGGRFYNNKDLLKADSVFFQQAFDPNSKFSKIVELLQPLQELSDYEHQEELKLHKGASKVFNTDKAYFGQRKGEYYLQTTTMVASLIHDGKWDYFDVVDGKLVWNKEKAGYELDETSINKMSDKIQRLNQLIHGRYSQRDAAALGQTMLYRMATQFRKWVPTAIEARFAARKFDNRLGVMMEGRWRTYGTLIGELIKYKGKLKDGRKLSEMELYNMRKNLTEIVVGLGIYGSYLLLKPDKDDKDKKVTATLKFFLDQTNRLAGDLLNFYNPEFGTNLLRSSIPLGKTIDDTLKAVMYLPHIFGGEDSEYRSGNRKGENKFWGRALDLVPFVNQAQSGKRLFNGQWIEM